MTGASLLRQSVLPGFIPRILEFFKSGFAFIAYLIAIIFEASRLLPKNHAYLNPANFGQFGLRHVLVEAGRNLTFTKQHIDQIVIYFTILTGIAILSIQFILGATALITHQKANAQLYTVQDIMSVNSQFNPGPSQDMVFNILDRIFISTIFNSCISDSAANCLDENNQPLPQSGAYPAPAQKGLYAMLEFYSYGIFMISIFIILYFITALVAETAASGTPFGKRANKIWVPVRVILFLALLVPLNVGSPGGGLNAAQLITLWSAKIGSNFATNTWGRFNKALETTYLGPNSTLVATPNVPELGSLIKFLFIAKTCKIVEEMAYGDPDDTQKHDVQPYLVREPQVMENPLIPGPDHILLADTEFNQAAKFANYGNIAIRVGVAGNEDMENFQDFKRYRGYVDPLCGELKLTIVDSNTSGTSESSTNPDGSINPPTMTGAAEVQQLYFQTIKDIWEDTDINKNAECIVRQKYQAANNKKCPTYPERSFAITLIDKYERELKDKLPKFVKRQQEDKKWDVSAQMLKKGWGGAAIWYNRIAEINGKFSAAVLSLPQPSKNPKVLAHILNEKKRTDDTIDPFDPFNPLMADGEKVQYQRSKDENVAQAIRASHNFWEESSLSLSDTKKIDGNFIIDTINMLFGTSGIFDMRSNAEIHPLAQLTSLGRGMMEASIRNIGFGLVGHSAALFITGTNGLIAKSAGNFMTTIGLTTIAMSFVLFYVLPFLPFIYFLFAVSGWIKSIFEAIVAMPLWALAHILRIDGEGIPGPAATNGYFLIFEIFLRPILILFGLIASIQIFTAMIFALNDVFELVVANISGFDVEAQTKNLTPTEDLLEYMRSPVDEFFFTILYTIVVYMIALNSFKIIDLIPSSIMRWMNVTASTTQEIDKDQAGNVAESTYRGAKMATGSVSGGQLAALVG